MTEPDAIAQALFDPPRLAREPRILDLFARDLERAGVVGERKLGSLIYLAVTSRLDRPVSVGVKGPSAGGKSFTIDQVLSFHPSSAFYVLSSMSERALAYSDEPLAHRQLVIYEAAGLNSDLASYLVRSLLSEGCVRYETVEKTKDGLKARLIYRPGPTGLIVTTTAINLHPENETRLLAVTVNDTAEQTRKILNDLAAEREDAVDRGAWRELQTWLERAEHRASIPFAVMLAELVPPAAVRLRRDFGALLNLIRAHAILHQLNRDRDGQGRIVATLEDYDVVRDLVADLIAEGVEATVLETVRETVATVGELVVQHPDGVGLREIGRELRLDRSAASRRARAAASRGYLVNREDRRGKPARYVLGEPLPEELQLLPSVETLRDRCTVAGVSEGDKSAPSEPHLSPSDSPATLQHPSDEPGWIRLQREVGEEPGQDENAALELLQTELGAVATDVLDYIRKRRLEDADFTKITAELNRHKFAPPPGRERWDLACTVEAYGVRHP